MCSFIHHALSVMVICPHYLTPVPTILEEALSH